MPVPIYGRSGRHFRGFRGFRASTTFSQDGEAKDRGGVRELHSARYPREEVLREEVSGASVHLRRLSEQQNLDISSSESWSVCLRIEEASVRKASLPAEVQAFLEKKWPGFISGCVSKAPVEEKVCPEEVVVEEEGLSSDEEDEVDGLAEDVDGEEDDDEVCSRHRESMH